MDQLFESDIKYLGRAEGTAADIWIKRDDLIPFSYGGNKVRIAAEIFGDIRRRGCTSVITYGSPGSNLNRAIAAFAKKEGIRCHAVIKKDEQGSYGGEGAAGRAAGAPGAVPMNERLVRSMGADITYCRSTEVRAAIEAVFNKACGDGERPYYVYGDSCGNGNTCTLMRASHREYLEIAEQEQAAGLHFDHIFLAVGTGMTISGLIAGYCLSVGADSGSQAGDSEQLMMHGISVARNADAETGIIFRNLREYGIEEPLKCFEITDRYLFGGYGGTSHGLLGAVRRMYEEHGIAMDPTYTGKAFYGMLREINDRELSGSCLFIHTGGFPGFLDKKDCLC